MGEICSSMENILLVLPYIVQSFVTIMLLRAAITQCSSYVTLLCVATYFY